MKLILYLMAVLNVLTFAWFSYNETNSEAEKTEFRATTSGVKKLRLLNEREHIKDVSAHIYNRNESGGMCHTIGPLENHDAAQGIVAALRELGREGIIRADRQKIQYAYWVYLESMPGDELEKIVAELESSGIEDYHQNSRNELSLGIYNGIQGAKQRQLSIAALGYSPLVGPLYRTETHYWVDVADMSQTALTDDEWKSYQEEYPEIQRNSEKCELINA